MVHTRMLYLARSLAIGKVIPTMAPLLAEYAACPTWPSKAATLAVFTITPTQSGGEKGKELVCPFGCGRCNNHFGGTN